MLPNEEFHGEARLVVGHSYRVGEGVRDWFGIACKILVQYLDLLIADLGMYVIDYKSGLDVGKYTLDHLLDRKMPFIHIHQGHSI